MDNKNTNSILYHWEWYPNLCLVLLKLNKANKNNLAIWIGSSTKEQQELLGTIKSGRTEICFRVFDRPEFCLSLWDRDKLVTKRLFDEQFIVFNNEVNIEEISFNRADTILINRHGVAELHTLKTIKLANEAVMESCSTLKDLWFRYGMIGTSLVVSKEFSNCQGPSIQIDGSVLPVPQLSVQFEHKQEGSKDFMSILVRGDCIQGPKQYLEVVRFEDNDDISTTVLFRKKLPETSELSGNLHNSKQQLAVIEIHDLKSTDNLMIRAFGEMHISANYLDADGMSHELNHPSVKYKNRSIQAVAQPILTKITEHEFPVTYSVVPLEIRQKIEKNPYLLSYMKKYCLWENFRTSDDYDQFNSIPAAIQCFILSTLVEITQSKFINSNGFIAENFCVPELAYNPLVLTTILDFPSLLNQHSLDERKKFLSIQASSVIRTYLEFNKHSEDFRSWLACQNTIDFNRCWECLLQGVSVTEYFIVFSKYQAQIETKDIKEVAKYLTYLGNNLPNDLPDRFIKGCGSQKAAVIAWEKRTAALGGASFEKIKDSYFNCKETVDLLSSGFRRFDFPVIEGYSLTQMHKLCDELCHHPKVGNEIIKKLEVQYRTITENENENEIEVIRSTVTPQTVLHQLILITQKESKERCRNWLDQKLSILECMILLKQSGVEISAEKDSGYQNRIHRLIDYIEMLPPIDIPNFLIQDIKELKNDSDDWMNKINTTITNFNEKLNNDYFDQTESFALSKLADSVNRNRVVLLANKICQQGIVCLLADLDIRRQRLGQIPEDWKPSFEKVQILLENPDFTKPTYWKNLEEQNSELNLLITEKESRYRSWNDLRESISPTLNKTLDLNESDCIDSIIERISRYFDSESALLDETTTKLVQEIKVLVRGIETIAKRKGLDEISELGEMSLSMIDQITKFKPDLFTQLKTADRIPAQQLQILNRKQKNIEEITESKARLLSLITNSKTKILKYIDDHEENFSDTNLKSCREAVENNNWIEVAEAIYSMNKELNKQAIEQCRKGISEIDVKESSLLVDDVSKLIGVELASKSPVEVKIQIKNYQAKFYSETVEKLEGVDVALRELKIQQEKEFDLTQLTQKYREEIQTLSNKLVKEHGVKETVLDAWLKLDFDQVETVLSGPINTIIKVAQNEYPWELPKEIQPQGAK